MVNGRDRSGLLPVRSELVLLGVLLAEVLLVVSLWRGKDLPAVGASASRFRPDFARVLLRGEVTFKNAVDRPPGMLGVRGMGVRAALVLLAKV